MNSPYHQHLFSLPRSIPIPLPRIHVMKKPTTAYVIHSPCGLPAITLISSGSPRNSPPLYDSQLVRPSDRCCLHLMMCLPNVLQAIISQPCRPSSANHAGHHQPTMQATIHNGASGSGTSLPAGRTIRQALSPFDDALAQRPAGHHQPTMQATIHNGASGTRQPASKTIGRVPSSINDENRSSFMSNHSRPLHSYVPPMSPIQSDPFRFRDDDQLTSTTFESVI